MKKIEIILSVITLCIILISCNTGVDGRYKAMYSSIGSEEYIFESGGKYTYEIEWNDNPSIMGSGGTKKGEIGKDEGFWWLDTTDFDGNKVTSVEFMKDPDSHNVWLNYTNRRSLKTDFFLIKNRDDWYPELWKDGEKECYKTFFPF